MVAGDGTGRVGVRAAMAVGTAAAALVLAACDANINVDSKTTHTARDFRYGGKTLTLAVDNDVSVVPGGSGTVRAERWLTGAAADKGNSRWALSGTTMTLTASCVGVHLDCGSRYQVAVPKGIALRIVTRYGDVSVRDVAGGVTVDAVHGDTSLTRVGGRVRIDSTYGEVTGSRLASTDVRAHSDNGDLRLVFAVAPSRVTVESTYGEVSVQVPAGSYHTVTHSKYGDVRNGITNDPNSPHVITAGTDNGDVTLATAG